MIRRPTAQDLKFDTTDDFDDYEVEDKRQLMKPEVSSICHLKIMLQDEIKIEKTKKFEVIVTDKKIIKTAQIGLDFQMLELVNKMTKAESK